LSKPSPSKKAEVVYSNVFRRIGELKNQTIRPQKVGGIRTFDWEDPPELTRIESFSRSRTDRWLGQFGDMTFLFSQVISRRMRLGDKVVQDDLIGGDDVGHGPPRRHPASLA
jgi:hypothetical protein